MDIKKVAIGVGSGLVVNTLVEKAMSKTWQKVGSDYSESAKQLFQELIDSGMSEEEAALFVEKNAPIWKKLGSRRINGMISLGVGFAAYKYGNPLLKTMGSGIIISGALKTLFPTKSFDLEFWK